MDTYGVVAFGQSVKKTNIGIVIVEVKFATSGVIFEQIKGHWQICTRVLLVNVFIYLWLSVKSEWTLIFIMNIICSD